MTDTATTPVLPENAQDYFGTKRVTAWPMTRGSQSGYGVRYADGYTSWSPSGAFEAAYRPVTAMDFGGALAALKQGHVVTRAAWSGEEGGRFLNDSQLDWFVNKDDLEAEDWRIIEVDSPPTT